MSKSIVVLTLAAVVASLGLGCASAPREGVSVYSPRRYLYVPSIAKGPSGSKEIH